MFGGYAEMCSCVCVNLCYADTTGVDAGGGGYGDMLNGVGVGGIDDVDVGVVVAADVDANVDAIDNGG